MSSLEEFYEAYGQSLATRLASIGHTEPKPRFIFVDEMGQPDELIRATTSKLKEKTNVLVWEAFTERLGDGRRDNYHTRVMGSLAVLRKEGTDTGSQKTAIRMGRQTALKVMALMLQDTLDGELAQEGIQLQFDGQDGEKIRLASGWCGWGYTFDWLVGLDLTLTESDLVA
ncbi:hypothetical protein [Larkinella soli]|uniref:hypothetical protein n=1 Tax=Larkinella soli TaxID=1770527 RepID=UPI000FFC586E|nr:hypothetical protein [Larkinella soli]